MLFLIERNLPLDEIGMSQLSDSNIGINSNARLSDHIKCPTMETTVWKNHTTSRCSVRNIKNNLKMDRELSTSQYADFQTPPKPLAKKIVNILKEKHNILPEVIIEPTCGKGAFIHASLENFKKNKNTRIRNK